MERHWKKASLLLGIYLLLAVGFSLIAGPQLDYREETTDMLTAAAPIGELVETNTICQPFVAQAEGLSAVKLMLSTYDRVNTGALLASIEDMTGRKLAEQTVSLERVKDQAVEEIRFDTPVQTEAGRRYQLVLRAPDSTVGNAITVWYGNTIAASRVQIPQTIPQEDRVLVNGASLEGKLVCSFVFRVPLWFGQAYWYLVGGFGLVLLAFFAYQETMARKGRPTWTLRVLSAFRRYGFLMKQLISRDFKTKYKRSVLGVLWSFLNPLLTMLVQYVVFSTLFKSDVPNFPLYLLTGIVCFNFFNEATAMSLLSITGNASLITKVYVPKYIYPVSRVLSSAINLLLSLLPLFAVMLLTRAPLRPALLLLPFGIVCLVALCMGMAFLLSTAMVFFRDTQFLWGVLSMLWMYATPIFYPESIIPDQFMTLYKCNPLYHIIRFTRIVLIDGVSPEPKAYGLCLLVSLIPLLLGAVVFKKNQDKFVLNL